MNTKRMTGGEASEAPRFDNDGPELVHFLPSASREAETYSHNNHNNNTFDFQKSAAFCTKNPQNPNNKISSSSGNAKVFDLNNNFRSLYASFEAHLAKSEQPAPLKPNVLAIEPKVLESFEPVPNRVPRKIVIERKRVKFTSFDFEAALAASTLPAALRAFDARKSTSWLPLEAFVDEKLDDYSVGEWLRKAGVKNGGENCAENGVENCVKNAENDVKNDENCVENIQNVGNFEGGSQSEPLCFAVNALFRKAGNDVCVKRAILQDYDFVTQDFYGFWEHDNRPAKMKRAFFCFESEDPQKWLQKLEAAAERKRKAILKMQYNFTIDRMSTECLNPIETEMIQRLLKKIGPKTRFRKQDFSKEIESIQSQFHRSMNRIIFDRYFPQMEKKFALEELSRFIRSKATQKRKKAQNKKSLQFKGIVSCVNARENETLSLRDETFEILKPMKFQDAFKEFCFSSLFIKQESIAALHQVKSACENIKKMRFFALKAENNFPRRLDEFKNDSRKRAFANHQLPKTQLGQPTD